jgi:GNAT superfamily N-acetyltransferase
MDPIMTDVVSLGRFIGDSAAALVRTAPANEVRQAPGATLALSGEPVADLNYITLDVSPDPAARLREFATIIQARQLPVLVLLSAAVADVVAPVAQDLGLTLAGQMPLMTHDGHGVPDAPGTGAIVVTRVVSVADLAAARRIMAQANAMPEDAVQRAFGPGLLDTLGVEVFLARQEDRPLSAVITTRHGATVGIWCMATLPESQRAGVGRALLTQVMARHNASGARLYYLGATEAGYPLYERMGFRTVETLTIWVAGHSTQVHG